MVLWNKLDAGDKITLITTFVTFAVWWHFKGKHKV